jgi:hypothetical protein
MNAPIEFEGKVIELQGNRFGGFKCGLCSGTPPKLFRSLWSNVCICTACVKACNNILAPKPGDTTP